MKARQSENVAESLQGIHIAGYAPNNTFFKGEFYYELQLQRWIWWRQLLLDYHYPYRSLLLLRQWLQRRQHLRLRLLIISIRAVSSKKMPQGDLRHFSC